MKEITLIAVVIIFSLGASYSQDPNIINAAALKGSNSERTIPIKIGNGFDINDITSIKKFCFKEGTAKEKNDVKRGIDDYKCMIYYSRSSDYTNQILNNSVSVNASFLKLFSANYSNTNTSITENENSKECLIIKVSVDFGVYHLESNPV